MPTVREKLGVCSLAMIYFPAMPALIAERLETVRGGVDFGCEVEGGGAAHGSIAATRTASTCHNLKAKYISLSILVLQLSCKLSISDINVVQTNLP